MKEIYVVMANYDTVEGRGPMIMDCIFENIADAEQYTKTAPGIMGRINMGDFDIKIMPLLSSLEEKKEFDKSSVKQRALAKLTNYEKQILGLK